ncbi:type I secretion system permease/ATPase [Pseudomonas sp. N040]|uniref:type I secretion system permease/ATPase n=1 Tax=Pseudomonas sp. N040 TaxID=2785325 RepID=UPI0018A26C6F|nr:type I secretion system permease/ATPase [Pseudomonas sp. N040]MBF7731667.1 type I secretion system permease/ATPase [Pseudomonas sp. N040]MBW7015311.1 type I secretion system permease/ATPase [Pseudomonas sp. N040]
MNPLQAVLNNPLGRTLRDFRHEFALVAALSMLSNLLYLAPTLYMLQIYDRVLSSQNQLTLLVLSLLLLVFVGIMALAEWVRSRLLIHLGVRFDQALNTRIFRAGLQAELRKSAHNPEQALADLTNLRQFLTGGGCLALFDAPWTPIYVAVSFMLHPLLGWLSLFFVGNLVALAILGQRRSAGFAEAAGKAEVAGNNFLLSKLRNSEVIEPLGMLGNLRRRWSVGNQQYLHLQSQAQRVSERMLSAIRFVRYSQQSLALGAGALLAIQGEISIGSMVAASVLMSRASQPIEMLVLSWKGFISARSAFERLGQLLLAHPLPAAGQQHSGLPSGQLRVQGLTASAPRRQDPIIQPLDKEFPPGQFCAIIGPSGSGKSTLARALIGIWPDTRGQVLLDGLPLQDWASADLGRAIGYLPQDIQLFEGTVAENIARLGEVDSAQVIEAARKAGVNDLILRLPQGYDTPIGESGSALSGGQRQRIGLARALYGDPQLIILDEPNANLDDAGEAALISCLKELQSAGRNLFVISHRTNIVALADRVLLLDKGVVTADGPPEPVLATLRAHAPRAPSHLVLTRNPA